MLSYLYNLSNYTLQLLKGRWTFYIYAAAERIIVPSLFLQCTVVQYSSEYTGTFIPYYWPRIITNYSSKRAQRCAVSTHFLSYFVSYRRLIQVLHILSLFMSESKNVYNIHWYFWVILCYRFCRIGVNKLSEILSDMVAHGLQSVIVFGILSRNESKVIDFIVAGGCFNIICFCISYI